MPLPATQLRLDEPTATRLRRLLLKKGHEIATLLADVLAHKDRDRQLHALPVAGKPGERPHERLRRFLDLIESRRRLIDARDDRYGRCDICGADLGVTALGDMPWADRCPAHPVTATS